MIEYFKSIKYYLRKRLIYYRWILFGEDLKDCKSVPIIINNFNRLTTLKQLISSLESRGYKNIYIIDNNSSYPPLLEYYEECPYEVFRLRKNIGHKSIWKTGIYKKFWKGFYVYTDSDVVPDDQCPDDFIEHFHGVMKRYPLATKVGFSLKITDLPDVFQQKQAIVDSQKIYWEHQIEEGLYRAPIDTTFALYRPFSKTNVNWHMLHIRTAGDYTAKHLPWYNDSANLSDEEYFYINSCSSDISTYARMSKLVEK